MPTLLHIDASPRGDQSISRRLSAAFVEAWKAKHPDGQVVVRDLEKTKPQLTFVDMEWIGGAFTPPEAHTPEQDKALAFSNELVAELIGVDAIVIGAPMYNFAIPAVLKAWVDHIVRYGVTFSAGPDGYKGLVPAGKRATFLLASGGNYGEGSGAEAYNQETPYLKSIFGFIGITDTQAVLAGGTSALMQGKVSQEEFLKPLLEKVKAVA